MATFLVPTGIGDCVWTLPKIQSLAAQFDGNIDFKIACWNTDEVESRALEFLRRFQFVRSAELFPMPRDRGGPILRPGPLADSDGCYNYLPDGQSGIRGIDYVMVPNAPLERGERLESWLPQFPTDWNFIDQFTFTAGEIAWADRIASRRPFILFYPGPPGGNGIEGHNRGPIWRPEDWAELGRRCQERSLAVIVVGAPYDHAFYLSKIKPLVKGWHDLHGLTSLPQLYALARHAKAVVAYQSGIGIVSHYLGCRVAMWWRAKGDSINPNHYISFSEDMAHCWTRPDYQDRYLPMIYGRHDVDYLWGQLDWRGWL